MRLNRLVLGESWQPEFFKAVHYVIPFRKGEAVDRIDEIRVFVVDRLLYDDEIYEGEMILIGHVEDFDSKKKTFVIPSEGRMIGIRTCPFERGIGDRILFEPPAEADDTTCLLWADRFNIDSPEEIKQRIQRWATDGQPFIL